MIENLAILAERLLGENFPVSIRQGALLPTHRTGAQRRASRTLWQSNSPFF
jgi:hypothetical protein